MDNRNIENNNEKELNSERTSRKIKGLWWKILIGVVFIFIVVFVGYRMYNSYHSFNYPDCPSCDKPVIYLYSEEEINVDVKVKGVDFTTTYPLYLDNWSVQVTPNGTIKDMKGKEYNYLYWEGVPNNFVLDMSKGFVVAKENYIEFFESKLLEIGLTDKEACDFITYWLPYCNEFKSVQVSFQMENYEEAVDIDFSIEPDNELRVFVALKGLDKMIDIEEQDLSYYADFKREGFTVVEWGGTFIKE